MHEDSIVAFLTLVKIVSERWKKTIISPRTAGRASVERSCSTGIAGYFVVINVVQERNRASSGISYPVCGSSTGASR